jgi:protein TonB
MSAKNISSTKHWPRVTAHPDFFWEKSHLLTKTRLNRFLMISLLLHFIVVVAQGLWPTSVGKEKVFKPIQVRFMAPKTSDTLLDEGRIIDAPVPEKIEEPRTKDLLSSFNSRAHSNKKVAAYKEYRKKKSVAPKMKGTAKKALPVSATAPAKPDKPKTKLAYKEKQLTPLPISPKGTIKPPVEEKPVQSAPSQSFGNSGSLALLDGFDAEKYASFDTHTPLLEDSDDDTDTISLDTRETKYASYFARIQNQIERVWVYPSQAAQRGVSGEVTLRFKISKDGNLIGIQLIEGSLHEILDLAAIKAIKESAPFYPFPLTIKKKKLAILATFVYSPNYGQLRHRPSNN